MIKNSLILNKFYIYANQIVKLKKINKKQNKIYVENLQNSEIIILPYEQYGLVLYRIYTIGEVSKIVEKRSDTIRKYEKKMLIPSATKFGDEYVGYSNWRFYTEKDVYEMVEFFNTRTPGRPVKTNINIKKLENKITRIGERNE